MVSPCSDRISRVPPYSNLPFFEILTGLSPTMARLSNRFRLEKQKHWPGPRSLATTNGVLVDVLSSGYLDVSVPRVRFCILCIQIQIPSFDICKSEALASNVLSDAPSPKLGVTDIEGGFPHSEIRGSKLVRSSPRLIAAYHVLHRLSAPRHPPNTLKALDRSHYRCPPLGSGFFRTDPKSIRLFGNMRKQCHR